MCGDCRLAAPKFEKAVAYGAYDGALRDLIYLLKYDRIRPAAGLLGRMLSETFLDLAPCFDAGEPLVIPVPLHSTKLRERGFNQSEMIARAALKCVPLGPLETGTLARKRATESQTGLAPQQRRANVRGAFVVSREAVSGRDILLVDDVMTTGTTASECARVLLRAGARRVWVATVARVLRQRTTGASFPDFEEAEMSPEASLLAKAATA